VSIKVAILSQKGNNQAVFSGIAVGDLNGMIASAISVEVPSDQVWIVR
jgi:hypothetical protein